MIILAESKNSKGKQLESLVELLLRTKGFEQCVTNVMANGAEIDVKGELPAPSFGTQRRQVLLCECKAHKAAIDMTQWCKFLGKIFHQEVVSQASVAGCFISLSGVTGPVQGNFDELARNCDRIELLHGDDLMRLVREQIPYLSLSEISRHVAAITERPVARFELAYNEGNLYWVISFSGSEYTILDSKGGQLTDEMSESLCAMAESELDIATFVDLEAEAIARKRSYVARALFLSTLFEQEGSIENCSELDPIDDYSKDEILRAALKLKEDGLLSIADGNSCEISVQETENGRLIPPDIYKSLLSPVLPQTVLATDFYKRHINAALLSQIQKIQSDMPIDESDVEDTLKILRLSPTAMVRSLHPLEMICTSRNDDLENMSSEQRGHLDSFSKNYYRQMLLDSLKKDFRSGELAEFYGSHCGFRELETITEIKLKSDLRSELESSCTERLGIGKAHESLGGGFIHVAMLPYAPQPWEPGGWGTNNESPDEH